MSDGASALIDRAAAAFAEAVARGDLERAEKLALIALALWRERRRDGPHEGGPGFSPGRSRDTP